MPDLRRTPKTRCGEHLRGSGDREWPGSPYRALEIAYERYGLERELHRIQNSGGKMYFYGKGTSSGRGGPDIWTVVGDNDDDDDDRRDPDDDDDSRGRRGGDDDGGGGGGGYDRRLERDVRRVEREFERGGGDDDRGGGRGGGDDDRGGGRGGDMPNLRRTPKTRCGEHLRGSGDNRWPGSEYRALEMAYREYGLEGQLHRIQNSGGKCYFYGRGTSSGRGGPEIWTVVGDGDDDDDDRRDPDDDDDSRGRRGGDDDRGGGGRRYD